MTRPGRAWLRHVLGMHAPRARHACAMTEGSKGVEGEAELTDGP